MNFTHVSAIGCLALMLTACNSVVNNKNNDGASIEIDSLDITKVAVDPIDNCSFVGFSGVDGDSLFYFDRVSSYLYSISAEGHLGSRELGLGHSGSEIPIKNANYVCYSEESKSYDIMGGTYDMYFYDDNKKCRRVDMKPQGESDSFESSTAYTLWDEVVMASDKDYIYYNVIGNNDNVAIYSRDDYFDKAHIIMKVSKKDGSMIPFGKYSELYVANKNKIKHLPRYYFDVDGEGGLYVTYQADSVIYHCDKDFNIIETFGRQGVDMNTDYSDPGNTIESFANALSADAERVGQYYWIKKCGDYVFRSYFKSKESKTDGLQIYKDGVLVGDVDVPHKFKVVGKIKDYWFTSIASDEGQGKQNFYKFKFK